IAVTFGIRPRMRFSRALLFFGMLFFAVLALQVYTSSGHIIGASYGDYLHNCYENTNTAGGLLFGLVAFPIMKAITAVGALVVSCAAFFILVLIAIFPSIRRNVTYDAPSRKKRRVRPAKEDRDEGRSEERRSLFPKKQKTEHLIEATSSPVITDLSQTQTDPLYVVDVEGDPMPQKRSRKAKGADGYQPLSTFNPLYPNRNGGYEDEVLAPQRQPDTTYVNMSTQDMARDILFGQNPSDEIISRFNDARNKQTNTAPIYNNARRNEMRAQFGVPQESMREEFISKFRAPKNEDVQQVYPQSHSPIHLQEGQIVGNISSQTNIANEQPVKQHDFFSLQEEQNRLFMTTKREDIRNMFGQQKPVVKSDRVMPRLSDADAINSTIRKAEDAVSGEVNVGMLGALNLAKSGGELQKPAVKQEIVSEAYTEPQIPVQPQMPVQQQMPVQPQVPVIQRPVAQQNN
ncbi:MAG: energy-coupling factor transporter transmembrane protein EcfT, partial [Clostridia bacterium]|nr:energy-coupling factor transporter transmembrane protein EcfT [Clostridia bacterium]